ncbi:hypothetical protein ACFQBQ_15405 [Granulicella cerasi]|uniref:Uncharacterized protein n=1 Tax=Granulicella cerasi TaxID=741063 RepID=A0ABW1ZD43_9BACT
MTPGNKVGVGSIIALYFGCLLLFAQLPFLTPIGIALALGSILGWCVAGVLKPRWWFVPPVVLVGVFVWLLSLAE